MPGCQKTPGSLVSGSHLNDVGSGHDVIVLDDSATFTFGSNASV